MKASGFDYLKKITAIDYNDHIDVLYLVYNIKKREDAVIRATLKPDDLSVETVMRIYRAADWYERELSEMFGIKIKGRRVKRLLLELWNGADYPLRKSFVWGKDYNKVK
ncbi:NADH-quinone oxidoreductase subunit C [Candidatus Marsarchaeota archaeon]|nr:NADH-quinone oxidoreductase subunit C [Candidatus Marsarchaeota archaeon]